MARDERRARRRARREEGFTPAPATPTPAPAADDREHAPRRMPGGFVRESIAELRKVEWPGQNQVVQGTVVVLIACLIIGTYLYASDQVFRRFVENVLLGQ